MAKDYNRITKKNTFEYRGHPLISSPIFWDFRDFYCKYIFDFKSCCGRETNFKNSQIAGSAIKNNDKREIFRRDCRFVKKSNVAIKNLFFGSQGIRKFFDICKSCKEKFLQYVVHYIYKIFLLSFYLQHS